MVESFSVEAGITAQSPDYLDRVREFTLHEDLRALFGIAVLEVHFRPEGPGVALALTAPERDMVLALDGLTVNTENGPVQAVQPGGTDQDLPALEAAMPFFEALAASASYCIGNGPISLSRHIRPGHAPHLRHGHRHQVRTRPVPYWTSGSDLPGPWPSPDNTDVPDLDVSWNAPAPVPDEFRDAPWLSSDVPRRGQQPGQAVHGHHREAPAHPADRLPRLGQRPPSWPGSSRTRPPATGSWPWSRTKSDKRGWMENSSASITP